MLDWTIDQCLEKHHDITMRMNEVKQETDTILKKVTNNPELAFVYKNYMAELEIEIRSLMFISVGLTNYIEKQLNT